MRYLRILTNSLAGAGLGVAYLTILFLQLNPHVPAWPQHVVPLYVTLVVFYGPNLMVLAYALIVVRQVAGLEVVSPAWLSVRLLAWLSTLATAVAALLMWLNLRGLRVALDTDAAERMAWGATALTVAAATLVVIALVRYSFGRRGSGVSGVLLAVTVVASIVVPCVGRGPGRPRLLDARRLDLGPLVPESEGTRVVMLLVDGASFDYVAAAVAEGRLPNLGRILDTGGVMYLTTIRPTQPVPVWTAVATGKFAPKNGVRAAATYTIRGGAPLDLLPDLCFSQALVHLGFVDATLNTSRSIDARPLWDILSGAGVTVGVIGWPLTYPAAPVRGFLVSPRLNLDEDALVDVAVDDSQAVFPADVLSDVRVAAETPGPPPVAVSLLAGEAAPAVAGAITRDLVTRRLTVSLTDRFRPRVFAARYVGLDAVAHRFLRYAMPRAFGDVSDGERRRYGQVLDRYYAFLDAEAGRFMASLEPDDLLLVVSGFGMEPVSPGKRLLERIVGDPGVSGSHERAPDGFLLAYGAAVSRRSVPVGSVVDVLPTLLYYLGLPVGRDMDGFARTDLFAPGFTAERPIAFIPTYER
jgi:hypothetical protein